MRKRTSRRRWKARALRGRLVPLTAIVEHRLDAWRKFEPTSAHSDMYFLPDVLSRASLDAVIRKVRETMGSGVAIFSVSQSGVRSIPPEEFYL